MIFFRYMRRWLAVTTIATAFAAAPAHALTPETWKDTGFSIDPVGMTLRGVMEQFAQVYGVRVSFDIKDVAVSRERLKSDTGMDFLDRLAQPYRFRWFVYGDILHIVPREDNAVVRLEVGEDAVQDAKGALVGMGLFDSRFGWGELPDEGIVVISGPREYVKLAREILMPDGVKAAQKGKQIMVFRLKYASATDRQINARGRSETIPGIKTILSNLVLSDSSESRFEDPATRFDAGNRTRTRKAKNGKGDVQEVRSSPFSLSGGLTSRAQQEESEEPAARTPKAKSSSKDSRPRIEADPTLNAIMIYDEVSKREMYQALIDELDVQPQQVEIEALIVDIDRSKLSEMGVEWGIRSGEGNVVGRMNSTQSESRGVDLPLPGSTLLISNAARFYARLKAMEGTGEARILATPTVLTLDNVAAVLDLSQTMYMPLLGERFADLADITAGTMLRVIPRIVTDGDTTRVRLEIDIEDGALGGANAQANVTRSTISTQAIIELQQTLMIGGYRSESTSTNQQKVPVLGDIPLVGGLFRNEATSSGSRERLFLITPRLLAPVAAAAASTSKVNDLAAKTLSQQRALEAAEREEIAAREASVAAAAAARAEYEAQVAAEKQEKRVDLKFATSLNTTTPSILAAPVRRSKYKCGPTTGLSMGLSSGKAARTEGGAS